MSLLVANDENVNPQRVQMLLREEEDLLLDFEDQKPILPQLPEATGANVAPLGDLSARLARPRPADTYNPSCSLVNVSVAGPPVLVPSQKRASPDLKDYELGADATRRRTQVAAVQDPVINGPLGLTASRLHDLVRPRPFHLTLEHRDAATGVMQQRTYTREITDAGLVLNKAIFSKINGLCLPLPSFESLYRRDSASPSPVSLTTRGQLLEDIWADLSGPQKHRYVHQLAKVVLGMRVTITKKNERLPGSVNTRLHALLLDKRHHGTFSSVQQKPKVPAFIAFLKTTCRRDISNALVTSLGAQLSRRNVLYLSHGELSPRNIVVCGDQIVGILRWDASGIYPEWWDYVKFFEAPTSPQNQDWYDYAPGIFFQTYPEELAAYQGLLRFSQ